jgi:hypothetical protein
MPILARPLFVAGGFSLEVVLSRWFLRVCQMVEHFAAFSSST